MHEPKMRWTYSTNISIENRWKWLLFMKGLFFNINPFPVIFCFCLIPFSSQITRKAGVMPLNSQGLQLVLTMAKLKQLDGFRINTFQMKSFFLKSKVVMGWFFFFEIWGGSKCIFYFIFIIYISFDVHIIHVIVN